MKLRTTGNSLRIRVRKSDLAKIQQTGYAQEEILFPNGNRFVFRLGTVEEASEPTAVIEGQRLSILLPNAMADAWISSNQVGIEHFESLPNGERLHILVEKDFSCGHRDAGEIEDFFPELKPST